MQVLALIAHDGKKEALLEFARRHTGLLTKFSLVATYTSGKLLQERAGLQIDTVRSGPLGGDIEIAAKVVSGEITAVIFFRDPLTAQPHEPDIGALLRACDVHNIPVATNPACAEMLLQGLKAIM
jgi:methylglyoxal synthase